MSEFHHTRMGQVFFESTMPRIASALEKIAALLEETKAERPFVELVWVVNFMPYPDHPHGSMMVCATKKAAAHHMKDACLTRKQKAMIDEWLALDEQEDDWVLADGMFEVHRAVVELEA